MDVFTRGMQVYLLGLAAVVALALLWATNQFILGRTTAGTDWIVMGGIAVVLVTIGAVVRSRRMPVDGDQPANDYPWD